MSLRLPRVDKRPKRSRSTLGRRRRSRARLDRPYRSEGHSLRHRPGKLAGMFVRVPESTAFRGRILRRSPPRVTVEADVLLHVEVHDPEESDEDQCGHSHGDGCPDAKFCHDVRVLPGALTLRERDVMRQLVEVTGASRGRILRRSPPRGPIEADPFTRRGYVDADESDER